MPRQQPPCPRSGSDSVLETRLFIGCCSSAAFHRAEGVPRLPERPHPRRSSLYQAEPLTAEPPDRPRRVSPLAAGGTTRQHAHRAGQTHRLPPAHGPGRVLAVQVPPLAGQLRVFLDRSLCRRRHPAGEGSSTESPSSPCKLLRLWTCMTPYAKLRRWGRPRSLRSLAPNKDDSPRPYVGQGC